MFTKHFGTCSKMLDKYPTKTFQKIHSMNNVYKQCLTLFENIITDQITWTNALLNG